MKKNVNQFALAFALLFASVWSFASPAEQGRGLVFQVIQSQLELSKSNVSQVSLVNQENGLFSVKIKLSKAAAAKMNKMTKDNIGKQANFVFNGQEMSASTLRSELGAEFILTDISGNHAEQIFHGLADTKN